MLNRIFCFNTALNISLFFIGLMFLLPFINIHYQQPIPTFYTEWIAAAMGLAAVFPLLAAPSAQTIKIPQISLIALGLAFILGIQWLLNMLQSTQYALLILSYFAWAYLLTILGATLHHELGWEKLVITLAYFLVIAGIINIGIVVLQIVAHTGGVIPFLLNLDSYGAMTQRNLFADFVTLAIISLMYLYAKGRFSLSFFTLVLTCFLIMLALSGSRSSWLHLLVLTVLAIAIKASSLKKSMDSTTAHNLLHISFLLLPMFILVQVLIYYVVPVEHAGLPTERLVDGINADTPSARLQILYDSARLFIQSPWLGTGFGTMRGESFLLIDIPAAMATKRVFEHAHNLFLHLMTEMGIGAFLVVSAGLIMWLRAFKWRELNLETWWIIALLAVLGAHSIVEFPFWFTFYLGIAAILLGAGDGKHLNISLKKITDKLSHHLNHKLALLSLATILLLGSVNLGTMFIANSKLENWVYQWMNNNTPSENDLDWVSQNSLLSPYSQLMSALSITVNSTDIDNKLSLSQAALRYKPLRRIAYNHALLLELKGDHANAVKQLNRALIAYPRDVNDILESIPVEYRQNYLNLLTEVSALQKNIHD